MALNNPLLRRFWFYTGPSTGFGVTAFSLDDAKELLKSEYLESTLNEIKGVVEDVDIQTLEMNHVRKNIGPTNLRGIWYPCLNLRDSPDLTSRYRA